MQQQGYWVVLIGLAGLEYEQEPLGVRVFPVPVGPSSRKIPAGRPSGARPAWYIVMADAIPPIAPD